MNARRNGSVRQPVRVASIGMEGARRIDDDVVIGQGTQIARSVQQDRVAPQIYRTFRCSAGVSTGNTDVVTVDDQKPRQFGAKHAIPANQQDFHRIRRFWKAGSGMAHMSLWPNTAYLLRARRW